MADLTRCPLCGTADAKVKRPAQFRHPLVHEIECPTCGIYVIDELTANTLLDAQWRDKRYRISAVAREISLRGYRALLWGGPQAQQGTPPNVAGSEPVQISEAIESRFPRGPDEMVDRALLNLWRMSTHYGQSVQIAYDAAAALLFARNSDEISFVTRMLTDGGYITDESSMNEWSCVLTPAGWNRVADLNTGLVGQRMDQAFVAMWFGNQEAQFGGRPSGEFSTDAFLHGFKPGVEAAGYAARRIDFKEFNDDIMDEVIAEIRRSRFVVADFTGQRSGVYYEAGFAKGLGLTVIFTCHKDHLAAAHFDTNHMNHIAWDTPTELATRLERRIVATVGQGPLKPQKGEA